MPTDVQHLRFQEPSHTDRVYSPDILPRLQSLLADLADIDLTYEKAHTAIERGLGEESLRRRTIAQLWQDHQDRRAPYVAALEELQAQVRDCFE
ncbi:hypothetical protein [Microvirga aerophila]|uniref:Uncharacterized protein n=1 Tax=Microvirga aerophila TaxID=670291 RepID=A0A512BWP6_9HYPH|nr:hypothetical protein [Microvirga aerophila]GEO16277.1 hypothetical protein MAE02_39730 [Microvirga aerophila]